MWDVFHGTWQPNVEAGPACHLRCTQFVSENSEIVPRRKRNTTHTLPHTVFAFDEIFVMFFVSL